MSILPEVGRPGDEVLAALARHRDGDLRADGRAFAFVYDAGEAARDLARRAFAACMPINGLDPTVYPSARSIENDVVGACLELLRAPAGAVGTATAGGTESVLLAVKAARDHARATRPEIARPAMLLPQTAHACFHKAGWMLGVDVIPVAVDPVTFRASVDDARAKWTRDVVLVVGSAPSYAHGVVDPIVELAALAAERGALCHVDACVGGPVLPFLREAGVSVPEFDLSVPGVTSLSMDLHKYGFAPKGVSVLLMRDAALRDAQYYACATWTGYPIVNSTSLGSKSVAALGGAWALLQHLGREGYRELARQMWSATCEVVSAIERTPGLRLLGRPDMNLLALTTEPGDVFELGDRLTARGWHTQVTYGFGPSPAHLHLTLDPGNARRVGELSRDLAACAVDLPPRAPLPEGLVAMLHAVGEGALDPRPLMAELGVSGGGLPARAAMIHRLLDAASPATRERVLVAFMGGLMTTKGVA
ncbi:MAG: aspartate aminotransferase family protein [Polyangiaceae bacterium]|nr:aspartate aminotransferase family protein [Polyangiaceae bacterium]